MFGTAYVAAMIVFFIFAIIFLERDDDIWM